MASVAGEKRGAPDSTTHSAAATPPPNLRQSEPQPQQPSRSNRPQAAAQLPPYQLPAAPSPPLPTITQSSVWDLPVMTNYFLNEAMATASFDNLRQSLSNWPADQVIDIFVAAAKQYPPVGKFALDQIHRRAEIEAENKAKAEREQQIKKRKAEDKKKKTPLNLSHHLDRVWSYMHKETPWSWSHAREYSEAAKGKFAIEKIMKQVADRCAVDSPTEMKWKSFSTLVSIWQYIIIAPPSLLATEIRNDSFTWDTPLLGLWAKFQPEEKRFVATMELMVKEIVETAIEWSKYCLKEDMFDQVILDMRNFSDGAAAEQYDKWEAHYGASGTREKNQAEKRAGDADMEQFRSLSAARPASASAPSSDPASIDLTGDPLEESSSED